MTSETEGPNKLPLDHFELEYIPRHADPSLRDRELPEVESDEAER